VNTQNMPDDVERYSLVIEWSDEDRLYIVTVPELPGCRTHGKTQSEAVAMGRDAIETWLDANRAWGRPIPSPRLYADRVRAEDAADARRRAEGAHVGTPVSMTS